MSFELVKVKQAKRYGSNEVTISKDKRVVRIGQILAKQLDWVNGERVDLYFDEELKTYKLEKAKAGLINVKRDTSSMCITSKYLCIEILYRAHDHFTYEGWVENDTLFFKAKEAEN